MIIFTRFRDLPDEQMKHIVDYLEAGKPIIGLRTATHAFNIPKPSKTYAKYGWTTARSWEGGFGRQVLGETWVNHHGASRLAKHARHHRAGRGEPPDPPRHQGRRHLGPDRRLHASTCRCPATASRSCWARSLEGMKFDDKPVEGKKNEPMMPVAWTKTYKGDGGKTGRVFTTTMGASQDLLNEGMRRLLVNATYWAVGMEDKIPAKPRSTSSAITSRCHSSLAASHRM